MTAFPKISKNLSRRGFIGASALASAALMLQAGEAHDPASTRAQLAAVHSGSPAHQLLYKTDEFFIAHRGAGNISPEHTPYTYAESVRRGTLAVEISVRTTSDGQFVCRHDANIKRTTGASMDVRGDVYVGGEGSQGRGAHGTRIKSVRVDRTGRPNPKGTP
mgnify:CR=1 FL=1